ncbi:TIGR03086 family protein [Geodermatophilus sp. DF01-2]|uniref:TIGR03086 family metal-binding protein n=1 Tax=Geodermatophilus sp. DF01-2 TaxID=2559610 RepID=UPI00107392CF|nr:TIGR03086 family metal-binding protein [Geodermatophilus sp. DF01_2]TFV60871.1 TIGR03086 family protein [Geodermatophilus sp. DF01_2]
MADFSATELLALFQRAQAAFTDRVDAVEPEQWDGDALPGWTVADLVAHLVSEALWAPPLLAGEPYVDGRFPDDTADLLGDDPLIGWESAADAALAAFAEDRALLHTVHLQRGPTPAAEYIEEMTADLTVHSWDLARATGGDTELDPAIVTASLVVADRLPGEGVPGLFDPPLDVPPTASPQTRLLARFGRRG